MAERHPESVGAHVSRVDGNALAGFLEDALAVSVMTAAQCRRCQARFLLAETVVELDEVSAIVLCRSCTHTLFTVFRTERGTRVEFEGLGELVVDR
jgi:DNA-directed RNA polymerase subunit RPC12/RpoP